MKPFKTVGSNHRGVRIQLRFKDLFGPMIDVIVLGIVEKFIIVC